MALKMLILIFGLITLSEEDTALKMEAVCSSRTLVSVYKSIQCYNPEDQH
jgi:hypothetical protein